MLWVCLGVSSKFRRAGKTSTGKHPKLPEVTDAVVLLWDPSKYLNSQPHLWWRTTLWRKLILATCIYVFSFVQPLPKAHIIREVWKVDYPVNHAHLTPTATVQYSVHITANQILKLLFLGHSICFFFWQITLASVLVVLTLIPAVSYLTTNPQKFDGDIGMMSSAKYSILIVDKRGGGCSTPWHISSENLAWLDSLCELSAFVVSYKL